MRAERVLETCLYADGLAAAEGFYARACWASSPTLGRRGGTHSSLAATP